MKLPGSTNGKQIVTSISRHDYRSFGEGDDYIMRDGGIPGTQAYGGYCKMSGRTVWFEVPQTFAELYNDYQFNSTSSGVLRKYGIWDIEDVKILSPEEYPDINSFEWRAENAIFGTNGPNGNQPTRYVLLKDCEKEHLEKILVLLESRPNTQEMQEIVKHWLAAK